MFRRTNLGLFAFALMCAGFVGISTVGCSDGRISGGVSEETNTVAGILVDGSGKAVAGVPVCAMHFTVDSIVFNDTTDSDGKFGFPLMKRGQYGVSARRDSMSYYESVDFEGSEIEIAAKLQKTIVHETTKAALATKRNMGVKLGAANEEYQRNLISKSKEEKDFFHKKQALTRGRRYIENPETQAFLQILQAIFNLNGDISKWDWDVVTTKGIFKDKIFQRMEAFQKSEGLFHKWDLSKRNDRLTHQRLAAYIGSIHRSFISYYSNKKYENMTLEDYIKYVSSIATKHPHVVSNSKSTKRRKKTTNDKQEEVVLDTSRLNKIEIDTKESQKILSDIFIDSEPTENVNLKVSGAVMAIMKMLFTKEVWSYEEVETICKKRKQMIGSVLEQINDYALSKVDDIVLEDDGDNIYMMTEYKDMLL